jgi:hypothetical protein
MFQILNPGELGWVPPGYNETTVRIFAACQQYLRQLSDFLDGSRSELPDASVLCESLIQNGSILEADVRENGAAVAVRFAHRPKLNPKAKNPRIFDAWIFCCMLLMEIAGGKFRIHPNRSSADPAKKYYVRYEAPSKQTGGVYLLRIIGDTPVGLATPQLPGDHHDYRRAGLKQDRPFSGYPSLGRVDAIQLAVELFREHGVTDSLDITPEIFEHVLKGAFELADRMHNKMRS